MKQLIVLYGTPKSPEHFDDHYRSVHIPLARKMPGLIGFDVSQGPVAYPPGAPVCHQIAVVTYPDQKVLEESLASPEGKAAVADLDLFATGGVWIYTADMKSVL